MLSRLGATDPEVLAGPAPGVDVGVGYITPAMPRPGDRVLITKGAAIEAIALFAAAYGDRLISALGAPTVQDARDLRAAMTVVPEAQAAAAYGVRDAGVAAMHDATEGGVLGGLLEIADASDVGMVVDLARVPVRPEVAAVCDVAGMDPYSAISEGTLLLTARPRHVNGVLRALTEAGVEAAEIGEMLPRTSGRDLVVDGRTRPLVHPGPNPFWAAFAAWSRIDSCVCARVKLQSLDSGA